MKALIQRVAKASVTIEGKINGAIQNGLVVFLGVTNTDTEKEAEFLTEKIINLRIFEDENGKMNKSLKEVAGEVLVISQFTLYSNCRKGRRPSFVEAAPPKISIPLYEKFISLIRDKGVGVKTGEFGAKMEVEIHNSGPVTLMLEKEANHPGK